MKFIRLLHIIIYGTKYSSRQLFYVNSYLGWLHCVDVCSVANILEVPAASIFRVKVCRVGRVVHVCKFWCLLKNYEGRVGIGVQSGPVDLQNIGNIVLMNTV
jgi:hypothetical protein